MYLLRTNMTHFAILPPKLCTRLVCLLFVNQVAMLENRKQYCLYVTTDIAVNAINLLLHLGILIIVHADSLCGNNPCQNGGTCMIDGQWFKCQCPAPFGGFHCESKCVHLYLDCHNYR